MFFDIFVPPLTKALIASKTIILVHVPNVSTSI